MPYYPFDIWKRRVDSELIRLCGMSSDDLPDYDYRIAYDNKRNPKSVAKSVINAAKEY